MTPVDRYPSKPLNQIQEPPMAIAMFKEPIFKLGVFQNQYVEVEVSVYPLSVNGPDTETTLVAVRFGQMNVVRFVDRALLYNIQPYNK